MIYLDYSATTPVDEEILESFIIATKEYYGNPNSKHYLGIKSNKLLKEATKQVADILKVKTDELIFTSGATEANNLAILGAANFSKNNKRIITSKLEHPSIYEMCDHLEKEGFIIDYVDNDKDGYIDLNHLKSLIKKDTCLVSISALNSELGIRQSLLAIKQTIKKANPKTIFHSDLSQAAGKMSFNLKDVDLATFSSHKIYAPIGVGLLYKQNRTFLKPITYGGDEIRPGTPAVALITAFSKALRLANKNLKHEKQITKLSDKVKLEMKKYKNIKINNTKASIPHMVNISLMDLRSEVFVNALSKEGVYVSTTTACSTGKPSATVYNLYEDKQRALTTIRISISHLTTEEEIEIFLDKFNKVYNDLMK